MSLRVSVLLLSACLSISAAVAAPPEIQKDSKIVFRLSMPNAKEVQVAGDWLKRGEQLNMAKGDDGVWTVTANPLPPGNFIYDFNVDGTHIADPGNPQLKLRASGTGSILHVPGEAMWQARDVPHGTVNINYQNSKVLNETRWFYVYTPPGYEQNPAKKYPVLYLLHGNNDTAAGWVMVGQANYILDNLLAEKKAVEMIVVMPFGHAVPYGTRGDNTAKFEQYLLQDVIPAVEEKYRTESNREHRAIAGYSMGGGQTLRIGFGNLDKFSAIGCFSGATIGNFETQFAEILKSPAEINRQLKLMWLGCGTDDFAINGSRDFDQMLTTRTVTHTYRETDGVHNYEAWRRYLVEFAPQLFQK